jgi:hypothetical protein
MSENELKDMLRRVQSGIRITKVVATRSIKGKGGDAFAGFAAAWDTVQDDAGGPGADMDLMVYNTETVASGMTLGEARVAHYLVAMHADIAAHEAAMASGTISPGRCSGAIKALKTNYAKLIRQAASGGNENSK